MSQERETPLASAIQREVEHNKFLAGSFRALGCDILASASDARAAYLEAGGDPAGPRVAIRLTDVKAPQS